MEALIVGDTHGKVHVISNIISIAADQGYLLMIHLGDFGWWPTSDKNPYIMWADEHARNNNITLWAIDGNHDFPGENVLDQRGYSYWRIDLATMWEPGLHWVPRNTLMELGGKKVAFIGGAVSVDRNIQEQRNTWFWQELLTEDDVDDACDMGEVDVLISHDRIGIPPHFRQYRFGEKVENNLVLQKERWERIFSVLKPKVHFHGHFHEKYETRDEEFPGCHTIGLAAENVESFVGYDFEKNLIAHPQFEGKK